MNKERQSVRAGESVSRQCPISLCLRTGARFTPRRIRRGALVNARENGERAVSRERPVSL